MRMMRNDEHFRATRLKTSPDGVLRYKIDRFVPELLAVISGVQSIEYVEQITVDRKAKKMTLVSKRWESAPPPLLDVTTEYTEEEDGTAVAVSTVKLDLAVPAVLVGQAESLVQQLFEKEMKEQEKEILGNDFKF